MRERSEGVWLPCMWLPCTSYQCRVCWSPPPFHQSYTIAMSVFYQACSARIELTTLQLIDETFTFRYSSISATEYFIAKYFLILFYVQVSKAIDNKQYIRKSIQTMYSIKKSTLQLMKHLKIYKAHHYEIVLVSLSWIHIN